MGWRRDVAGAYVQPGSKRPAEGWSGVNPATTRRLIALLDAQRHEAAVRASLIRDSREWAESSERLDELNDRIMHRESFNPRTSESAEDERVLAGSRPPPPSR
jgi:hypothetical protein